MDTLTYQPLDESYANDLTSIWSDNVVIRFTNIKKPLDKAEIKNRIKRFKNYDVFAASNTNGFIGIIGCPCADKALSQYGLFYQFRKSSWGHGYATSAVKWMLRFMKEKHGNVTILADVVTSNTASEKILRHFGFNFMSEEDGFERDGLKMKIHNYMLLI